MSGFLKDNRNNEESFREEIDFNDATRLPDGGTTCEIYRTRWYRREVFVKRLKKEYRTNPIYLDALDKEFEIGTRLNHPALPYYREFHRDYIMLDYIDGQTLADLLQRSDPWLLNERNVVRMFKELIDVVDYLHRHNITHCDIKPDNIMITANNKNLVLIDLDKCYTDSLNDTSGDPSIYGLSEKERGNINIDFHGIGKIAESLKKYVQGFKLRRYKEFVKECHKPNVSSVKLLELLDSTPSKIRGFSKSLLFIVPMLILILSLLMLLKISRHETKQMEYISDDSISNIELQPDDAEQEFILYRPQQKNEFAENISGIQSNTQQQIYDEAQKMAAQLDIRIKPLYEKLNRGLDNLEKLRQNHNFSGQQLLDSLRKHTIKEEEYIKETYAILDETFPHLTEREFWRVLGFSKVYTGYKRRATPQEAALGKEIEMRQKNDSVDLAQ